MKNILFSLICAILISTAASERPRLPLPSPNTYWPFGVEETERQHESNDPLWNIKLAEIEKMRRISPELMSSYFIRQNPFDKSKKYFDLIQNDGSFVGITPEKLLEEQKQHRNKNAKLERIGEVYCSYVSSIAGPIWEYWMLGKFPHSPENERKIVRMLVHLFEKEYFRTDYRWVTSSFNMPRLAVRVYLMNLDKMDAVESGKFKDADWIKLNHLCKAIAGQCVIEWSQTRPGRPLTVDSFRGHGHWVGGNFAYRPILDAALVCRNPLFIDIFVKVSAKSLSLTNYQLSVTKQSFWQEGMTADGLGWGHGRQNYITRYPSDYLRHVCTNMNRLRKTLWMKEFPSESWRHSVSYVEGALWYAFGMPRYGFTMMVPGRNSMQYHANRVLDSMIKIKIIANELRTLVNDQELLARLDHVLAVVDGKANAPCGNRYFWNNDDLIIRRKDWFFGVNMVSRRSNTNEVTANQTSGTDFLGDGATYIMNRGDTYALAKGFWKSAEIPGVTARHADYIGHLNENATGYTGIHNFAGGAAEHDAGVAGFIYEKAPNPVCKEPILYKVKAYKAYFNFDDIIICLGNGIANLNSELPGNIMTTVDHPEHTGKLEYDSGNAMPKESRKITTRHAVHSGIGYAALGSQDFELEAGIKNERWLDFDRFYNIKQPERPRTLPVFKLSFDHGHKAENESYAYLVHMNCSSLTTLQNYLAKRPFRILDNTSQLQAVRYDNAGITQAVFYDAEAVLNDGVMEWRVDSPAVIQIRETFGQFVITVCDPEQNPEKTNLLISNGKQHFKIALPQGIELGKPVSVSMNQ